MGKREQKSLTQFWSRSIFVTILMSLEIPGGDEYSIEGSLLGGLNAGLVSFSENRFSSHRGTCCIQVSAT